MKPVPSGAVRTVVTPVALGSLQDEASRVAHSRMGELHQRHGSREGGRGAGSHPGIERASAHLATFAKYTN